MTVHRCRPKSIELSALQFSLGTTTKREILDFCPDANVGAPSTKNDHVGLDSTDLRWVMVPEPGPEERVYVPCHDTSWIMRGVTGEFFVVSDWSYRQTYEEIA